MAALPKPFCELRARFGHAHLGPARPESRPEVSGFGTGVGTGGSADAGVEECCLSAADLPAGSSASQQGGERRGNSPGSSESEDAKPDSPSPPERSGSGAGVPDSAAAVRVRRGVLGRLTEEARREPERECCGLLAGEGGVISAVLPARNVLESATAYEIAPEETFRLIREMRERGIDFLGIYHSHPATDNAPSPTDLERAYYPDATYFILSPRPENPRPVRAFAIRAGAASEIQILVSE